jgi:hypothetical protein
MDQLTHHHLTLRRTGRPPIYAVGSCVARVHHELLDERVAVYELVTGQVAASIQTRAPGSGVRLELAVVGEPDAVARWTCDRAPRTGPAAVERAGLVRR